MIFLPLILKIISMKVFLYDVLNYSYFIILSKINAIFTLALSDILMNGK